MWIIVTRNPVNHRCVCTIGYLGNMLCIFAFQFILIITIRAIEICYWRVVCKTGNTYVATYRAIHVVFNPIFRYDTGLLRVAFVALRQAVIQV